MSKNILFITTVGGFLTQFEKNDVRILSDLEYNIHYASNFENTVYELDMKFLKSYGVTSHNIVIRKHPVNIVHNLKALIQIRNIIKSENIDVIHCHNPMGGVLGRIAVLLLWKKKPTVIYTAHGFHFYKGASKFVWCTYYLVEKWLAKYTDYLITINDEDYQMAQKFYKKNDKNRVFKIPGVGVDIEKFQDNTVNVEEMKNELQIPSKFFVILSVGELNDNKNHKVILQAIENMDENVFYCICGKGESSEELKKLIKEKNLEDKVKLYGYRNDIPKVLACANCFVFPSKREGFGIAAVEALAAGVPVIASDCRGTREYMKHRENGFICDANDSSSFAKYIRRLYSNSDLINEMRDICQATAMRFSIEETDKIMKEVYKML